MAVELVFISTASGSRDAFDVYCHFLVAVEVAVEMAVDFQSGSRKKSGSRKTPHQKTILIAVKSISRNSNPRRLEP